MVLMKDGTVAQDEAKNRWKVTPDMIRQMVKEAREER
jgi:hypothetical protein